MRQQRHNHSRRGVQAVEFALIAPVLVLMVSGIIDYGWFFWNEALVTNALREGVRAGSLKKPDLDYDKPGECLSCEIGPASDADVGVLDAPDGASLTRTLQHLCLEYVHGDIGLLE